MKRIIDALKQESTWRGIIAIAAACGITIDPTLANTIIAIALGSIGAINVMKKD